MLRSYKGTEPQKGYDDGKNMICEEKYIFQCFCILSKMFFVAPGNPTASWVFLLL